MLEYSWFSTTIERAVEGAEGVISLLGQGKPVKGTPVAHGTRNILTAMKKHGVLRIVVIATASASDPGDVPPLRSRFFIGIAKLSLLKSPFLLLPLMVRPIVDTVLGDDVRAPLAPSDPTRMGAFARSAPA